MLFLLNMPGEFYKSDDNGNQSGIPHRFEAGSDVFTGNGRAPQNSRVEAETKRMTSLALHALIAERNAETASRFGETTYAIKEIDAGLKQVTGHLPRHPADSLRQEFAIGPPEAGLTDKSKRSPFNREEVPVAVVLIHFGLEHCQRMLANDKGHEPRRPDEMWSTDRLARLQLALARASKLRGTPEEQARVMVKTKAKLFASLEAAMSPVDPAPEGA